MTRKESTLTHRAPEQSPTQEVLERIRVKLGPDRLCVLKTAHWAHQGGKQAVNSLDLTHIKKKLTRGMPPRGAEGEGGGRPRGRGTERRRKSADCANHANCGGGSQEGSSECANHALCGNGGLGGGRRAIYKVKWLMFGKSDSPKLRPL